MLLDALLSTGPLEPERITGDPGPCELERNGPRELTRCLESPTGSNATDGSLDLARLELRASRLKGTKGEESTHFKSDKGVLQKERVLLLESWGCSLPLVVLSETCLSSSVCVQSSGQDVKALDHDLSRDMCRTQCSIIVLYSARSCCSRAKKESTTSL